MAQSRLITSDIWLDDWFGPLPYFDQLLWIGLFSQCADDQGRLLDNPVLIRAAVFPYKDTPIADIAAALTRFAEAGKLTRYEADGKRLVQIVNWWEHQRPQWAQASKWPAPEGWHDAAQEHHADGRHGWGSMAWRSAVLERDDWTCQKCGAREVELHAHHVKPWYSHEDLRFNLDNGVTLCVPCHRSMHRAGWKGDA